MTRRRAPWARVVAAGVALVAVAAAAMGALDLSLGARAALVLAGLSLFAWAIVSRRSAAAPAPVTAIEADDVGLARVTNGAAVPIARWDAPFGVTLLASYGRPTALLAFTSPAQTRYVPVRLEPRSEEDDALLARVALLADLDLVEGLAHEAALPATAAAMIVRRAEQVAPQALRRLHLSDGGGAPISLDRATLDVGGHAFDLSSPLEWRPLMFHESTGQASALYQATWIRQDAAEVVLVAPMPASIVPRGASAERDARGRLGRTLTRDLRLLQAPAEPPPPHEARVAIDRPFMIAVRRALDDAPLATRIAPEPPARSSRPERSGSIA